MQQQFTSMFEVDGDGNPAGGRSVATGIWIDWQNGPLGRGEDRIEPNGAFVETLVAMAIDRLQWYNGDGKYAEDSGKKFRCRENSLAITHLEEAQHWLNHRTARRETANTEGTHEGN